MWTKQGAPALVALLILVAFASVPCSRAQLQGSNNKFQKLGTIQYKHASFVEVEDVNGHDILLATSFGPFGAGKVRFFVFSELLLLWLCEVVYCAGTNKTINKQ